MVAITFTIIFAQKDLEMDNTQPVKKYWILFILSVIIQLVFLIWIREYFWIVLPFVLTTFCKSIRII